MKDVEKKSVGELSREFRNTTSKTTRYLAKHNTRNLENQSYHIQ